MKKSFFGSLHAVRVSPVIWKWMESLLALHSSSLASINQVLRRRRGVCACAGAQRNMRICHDSDVPLLLLSHREPDKEF